MSFKQESEYNIYMFRYFLLLAVMCIFLGSCAAVPTTNTPIPSRTTSPTPKLTSIPTLTQSPTRTITPTTTSTPTKTPTPSVTPTPSLIPGAAPTFPPSRYLMITNGNRDEVYIALTFDAGQQPQDPAGFDYEIYDILLETNTPATFFLGGHWATSHIEETRLLANNPLIEIGNHTWSHPDLTTLTPEEIVEEIVKTQDAIYQITGFTPRLFRLPGGDFNDMVNGMINWHGLYNIYWDVSTGDPVPSITADILIDTVLDRTQNGSIIIFHANGRGWHTAEALPSIITELRAQGYIFVTVSQLLGLEPIPETK
ncbi:MAG: polysaccharide deacetylase family protein [Chloroflexi bacterium]|nr:polysaccharide deacetylase family protein [Chloroflexota bacterium]